MPQISLFDTHAHLDDDKFAEDLDDVVQRSSDVGVSMIVVVGTTLASSRRAVEMAERFPIVHAAVGIHPNYSSQVESADWDGIVALAEHPAVVAIGETGMDRHWDFAPIDVQRDYFERHIRLSLKQDMPIVIHCREADTDVLEALDAVRGVSQVRGILHAFCGEATTIERGLAMGLHVSFAGQVTFKNKKFDALREMARSIPEDRILVETDSPYLSPEPLRGRRNEPGHVIHTASRLAEVRGVSGVAFADQTTRNAHRLFGV